MFITFEGIEGCGKSTQAKRVQAWLQEQGRRVCLSREPGGTAIGRQLRSILLTAENAHLASRAELFLYLADRAQHVHELIQPSLDQGMAVLVDRYIDSTVVYQGFGRGLDLDDLYWLNQMAVDRAVPDMTVLIDLAPETGLYRAQARNGQNQASRSEGRFEAESLAFHHRIRDGYLQLARQEAHRFAVVDGSGDEEIVFERVRSQVQRRFGLGSCLSGAKG